ncbi:MAG: hypothetical protein HY961_10475 [Ignavibacteriae bacterium]|nr:hypothetical protein [Ignavibacteriota bacterium]
MISPEDFYSNKDLPSRATKKAMWRRIEQALPRPHAPLLMVSDRRSFVYGMAAAFVLYLAGVGAFNLIKQSIEAAQSPEVRLEKAYQSAIGELESIVPSYVTRTMDAPHEQGKQHSREQQLTLVNEALAGIRYEIDRNGPSSVTSERVRDLYSLKLRILQQMVENGDIEL